MANPLIRIHDLETDTVVDREMTDDEYAKHLAQKAKDDAAIAALAKETEAKAAATAKLAALGFTTADLKALGL